MTEDDLRRRIDEIEAAAELTNARVFLDGSDGPGCEIVGNRSGLLRMGVELLKAATVPMRPEDSITPIKLDYLFPGRGFQIFRVSRLDDVLAGLPPIPPERPFANAVAKIGCLVFGAVVLVCVVTGFIVILQRLLR